MKPNFDLNQIGDLYVFIPNASIYANAVLTYGGVKIFSGPVDEGCRRAIALKPEEGICPNILCDSGDILSGLTSSLF